MTASRCEACGSPSTIIAERKGEGAAYRRRRCDRCGESWKSLDLPAAEWLSMCAKPKTRESKPTVARGDWKAAYESFRARNGAARNGRP